MTGGESKRPHILLAVTALAAEFLDSLAECFEEFHFIYHAVTFSRSLRHFPIGGILEFCQGLSRRLAQGKRRVKRSMPAVRLRV